MRKNLLFLFLMVAAATGSVSFFSGNRSIATVAGEAVVQPGIQAGNWQLDKSRSSIRFSVKHMVIAESEGYFKRFDGAMESAKADFSDAKINFTVDAGSIDTDNEKRDAHLRSEDFFNTAKFPEIRFVSTSLKRMRGKKYKLYGNLTIRDITRPVVFDVVYGGAVTEGNTVRAIFACTTVIDRFEYGLKWNKATEAGGLVVGQEVSITVKVEMLKG